MMPILQALLILGSALLAASAPASNILTTENADDTDGLRPASWPTFEQCEGDNRETIIAYAARDAQVLGKATRDYVKSLTGPTPRYTTWFGNYTPERHATVLKIFTAINTNDYLAYNYYCDCDVPGLPEDVVAYVYSWQYGMIHICPEFFRRNTTGRNTQAGTILHEATHYVNNGGGTEDWVSGTNNSLQLAIDDPDKAVDCAANYKYFAENTPFLN